ncbi:hypothetical protein NOR_06943 [Metarhizium rileyi]|uniref:Uncharacterized protein n=1 Tax=Metarhizium rileyi (strain RCEF 4871) TaxID=1649241 RepID=A0A166ZFJ5_METRR|nr:hypothetical protein NOR_06943 [Metarhizium rileyi RCEF 4871]
MPTSPRVQYRTIEVDENFFPSSAAKLIITQYLAVCEETFTWAWIIVGAFYDRQGRPLWSTEILVYRIEDDSDDSVAESTSDSPNSWYENEQESDSVTSPAREEHLDVDLAFSHGQYSHPLPAAASTAPIVTYFPPPIWNPVSQGPVPGHWQAHFDVGSGRWVHTWQPWY